MTTKKANNPNPPSAKKKENVLITKYKKSSTDYIDHLIDEKDHCVIICGDKAQKFYIVRLIPKKGANRNLISSRGMPLPEFRKSDLVKDVIKQYIPKRKM